MKKSGFTLLETLLALMIFSMAVVALVEAVNRLGNSTLHMRREAAVQERLRSLLLENTRLPLAGRPEKIQIQEADVTYTVTRTPLKLRNKEGMPLNDLFEVRATAEWSEGRLQRQATAETWMYPPLFRLPGT